MFPTGWLLYDLSKWLIETHARNENNIIFFHRNYSQIAFQRIRLYWIFAWLSPDERRSFSINLLFYKTLYISCIHASIKTRSTKDKYNEGENKDTEYKLRYRNRQWKNQELIALTKEFVGRLTRRFRKLSFRLAINSSHVGRPSVCWRLETLSLYE